MTQYEGNVHEHTSTGTRKKGAEVANTKWSNNDDDDDDKLTRGAERH